MSSTYQSVPLQSPSLIQDAFWGEKPRHESLDNASIEREQLQTRWRTRRWWICGLLLLFGVTLAALVAGTGLASRAHDSTDLPDDALAAQVPLEEIQMPSPDASGPNAQESAPLLNVSTPLPVELSSDRLPDDYASRQFAAETVEELDRELCGRSPCSFLIAARMNEQETKAQQHLGQLAMLAKSLNRTLVLPNVSNGRYAVCRPQCGTLATWHSRRYNAHSSFDFYHDLAAFDKLFDRRAVLWKDFVAYSKRRKELGQIASAQLIFYNHDGARQRVNSITETSRYKPKALCAQQAALDFDGYRSVIIKAGRDATLTESKRVAFGHWLVRQLRNPRFYRTWATSTANGHMEPDALFFYWGASRPIFLLPGVRSLDMHISLPFHSRWINLVERMSAKLQPFIALHWRQEAFARGVPDFVGCAKLAEKQVERFDAKSVYFMTDFPLDGDEHYHSDSYLKFLRAHPAYREAAKAGIDHLIRHFSARSGYRWTTLSGETPTVLDAGGREQLVNEIDTGLSGIIDKMMAERAEHYLVGEPFVCGRHSSYALQIVAHRMALESPVDYFPQNAKHRFESELQTL